MRKILITIFVSLVSISALFTLQSFQSMNVTDYLSIPGPISFEKESYVLKWSYVDKGHYKQEYTRAKDVPEKFNKMVFIEVLHEDLSPKELVSKKVEEIERRKGSDPVVNYEVRDNKTNGEYLLDFLISEGQLYEWNAYRYKTITTNKGKAVLLFAYTFRSFEGAELDYKKFFAFLKENRISLIGKVVNYELPSIDIKS